MSEKIKQDISIGKNLHRLRKQAGLSQEQVAVKLQVMGLPVSREIISQMELGPLQYPGQRPDRFEADLRRFL